MTNEYPNKCRVPKITAFIDKMGWTLTDFCDEYNKRYNKGKYPDRLRPDAFSRNVTGGAVPNWKRIMRFAEIIGSDWKSLTKEFERAKVQRAKEEAGTTDEGEEARTAMLRRISDAASRKANGVVDGDGDGDNEPEFEEADDDESDCETDETD